MFGILDLGASALVAQRTRMDTIAANIANISTTRNEKGELSPFRRKLVTFAAGQAGDPSKPGVHVSEVKDDQSPFLRKYDPGHPDADKDGYVLYPNIDLAIEQVNSLEASRAYEASITMMETTKAMISSSLRLIA
ncbi:flagellar basal body rod protein FlgC [soil metagenome]